MAIIMEPLAIAAPLLCDDEFRLQPEDSRYDGCPVLVRQRAIVANKGVLSNIRWPLRFPNGQPVNLLSCLGGEPGSLSMSLMSSLSLGTDGDAALKVRFGDCNGAHLIVQIDASSIDPENGLVDFQLPVEVADYAGLYQMQVAVVGTDSRPKYIEKGILSVEPSLWGDTDVRGGPLTLGEIRLALRDTVEENELLQDYEFDADEVVDAMIWPIREWNESPPPVARFSCRNFPFRHNWMEATIGRLLMTAAHHYNRNNLQLNHGGLSGNLKDKGGPYVEMAKIYLTNWKQFILRKKVEINVSGGYGSVSSPYGSYSGWSF